MIFNIRKPEYTTNPGCLNSNLAITNNQTEAQRNAYCTIIKQEFPPVKTLAPWIRLTRYGIYSVLPASKPDWSTVTTQYWTNMYYRATGSDIMSTRKIMFEPILNIRQNTGTGFMVRTCASPNYFGRNSSGVHVVADGSNTWRSDIRLQLGTFCGTDIGSTGGSGNLAQVLTTNFNVGLILGPNEIDPWGNARLYYVNDAECTGGAAPTEATRAGVSALAGSGGTADPLPPYLRPPAAHLRTGAAQIARTSVRSLHLLSKWTTRQALASSASTTG